MAISTNLGAFDRDRYEQEMYYRQRNAMLKQQMNSRYDIEQDCFIKIDRAIKLHLGLE